MSTLKTFYCLFILIKSPIFFDFLSFIALSYAFQLLMTYKC